MPPPPSDGRVEHRAEDRGRDDLGRDDLGRDDLVLPVHEREVNCVANCASHGLSFTERKWFGVIASVVIRHGLELDEVVRGLLEPGRERRVAERGGAVLPKVMLFAPARRSDVGSAFALALLAWREAGREVGVLTGGIVGLVRGGRDERSRAAAYSAAWNSFCGLSCGQARYIGAVLVDGA